MPVEPIEERVLTCLVDPHLHTIHSILHIALLMLNHLFTCQIGGVRAGERIRLKTWGKVTSEAGSRLFSNLDMGDNVTEV